MSFMKEFEHLKIRLEDIKAATDNFGVNKYIGKGGFGKVYKGSLNQSQMVAVKRLDRALGQGHTEFWKEIMMLSFYRHENLVSLVGFCDEGDEKILVYEYASNKSLDFYLSNRDLTWIPRLKICIGAARGLEYLHDPDGTRHRVLHRDIKSSNILLDENWKAKISDFGLSKFGPANQQITFLVSNAVGTFGYCDPLYIETGLLTKESDVYSFGVVLFEVMCERYCIGNYDDDRRFLPKLAQKCYEENKINMIISDDMKEQMAPKCIDKFSEIAYRCLKRDRRQRPSMAEIVKELEIAYEYQVDFRSAYNCEIVLTEIKISVPDIINAILSLNSSSLDIDQVEKLIKFCPTKEEIEIPRKYPGYKETLGKCKQFFMELKKVQHVESKLQVFASTSTYTSRVKNVKQDLMTISDATKEVMESSKLRQIMLTIFEMGNALNQSTTKPTTPESIRGIKLDSLLKLSEVRAMNNKTTLMHYLCKFLVGKMPELLDFDKDLLHLEAASKIQVKTLASEIQELVNGREKIEREIIAADKDHTTCVGFRNALKRFLETAEAEVQTIINLYSVVGRSVDALIFYFGDDPARSPFEEVTQILPAFIKMFKKALHENEQEEADTETGHGSS